MVIPIQNSMRYNKCKDLIQLYVFDLILSRWLSFFCDYAYYYTVLAIKCDRLRYIE